MSLPAGVTLKAIDGGATYYTSNGFTIAAAAGWDNPSFYPVGIWETNVLLQADADRWLALGMNTSWQPTGSTSMALLASNGISAIPTAYGTGNGGSNPVVLDPAPGSSGADVVGLLAADEPGTMTTWQTGIEQTSAVNQDGRFWWVNFTWNFIVYGGISPVGDSTTVLNTGSAIPGGGTRYIDMNSIDVYWFSGAGSSFWTNCTIGRSPAGDCSTRRKSIMSP